MIQKIKENRNESKLFRGDYNETKYWKQTFSNIKAIKIWRMDKNFSSEFGEIASQDTSEFQQIESSNYEQSQSEWAEWNRESGSQNQNSNTHLSQISNSVNLNSNNTQEISQSQENCKSDSKRSVLVN